MAIWYGIKNDLAKRKRDRVGRETGKYLAERQNKHYHSTTQTTEWKYTQCVTHGTRAPPPPPRTHTHTHTHAQTHTTLKGNSHQKISVPIMIELLLKSFLVYHSPMFEACKVLKRPVEVSCDVAQHLLAYRTAVGNRINSSGMRTHTGQYSRLHCMHALNFS